MHFRKVFITYSTVYLLILVLFICTLVPLGNQMQQIAHDRVIQENQLRIERGMQSLENQMAKFVQMSSLMCVYQDLVRLALLKDSELSVDLTIYMMRVKTQIGYFISLLDHVESCVLIFPKNQLYLSNLMIDRDYRQVYGPFFQVGDWKAEEFFAKMTSNTRSCLCLPESSVKLEDRNQRENMLIFLAHGAMEANMADLCAFAYLVKADALMQSLMPHILSDGGFAVLMDDEGQRLAGLGVQPATDQLSFMGQNKTIDVDNEQYVVFRTNQPDLGVSLVAGVPDRLITENTNLLMQFLPIYLMIGLVLSILLCVVYSIWHYKSVRHLITAGMQLSDIPYQNTNGYRYVHKVLEQISNEKAKFAQEYTMLDNAYLNNMLNSACIHGLYSQREIAALERYIGDLPLYCVAVLKYAEEMDSATLLKMEQEIQTQLPEESLISVHQKPQKSILIISGRNNAATLTNRVANVLGRILQGGELGSAGISDGLSGVEMIRIGYQQASQAIRNLKYSGSGHGAALYVADETQTNIADISTLNKLSDLVLSGKKDGVSALFHELEELVTHTAGITEEQFRETFYALRMVLQNVARELKVDLAEPRLQSDLAYSQALAALQDAALTLTAQIGAKQRRGDEELYQRIVEATERLMGDPALNAARVAEAVGCSEKYIYRVVKDWAGRSFGDQLERMRIAKTEALLLETKMNNEQIAQTAGFASLTTFYRAFRKAHGVTPAAWRVSLRPGSTAVDDQETTASISENR